MSAGADTTEPGSTTDALPQRAALRRLLRQVLRTDADLEAFCLDHFEAVSRRFSSGMDVQSKVNLLLVLVEPDEVLAGLRRHFRGDRRQLAEIDKSVAIPESPELREARLRQSELRRLYVEREQKRARGESTAELDRSIVEIKRLMRSQPQLQEGEVLGDRYEMLERIGHGGFAVVWQAFDKQTQRMVAVKVLHREQGDGHNRIERFQRGARQMQRLDHPHIARVLDGPAEHGGFHYFVMEYLAGGDLQRAVIGKSIDREAALQALIDVGAALEHAHRQGLVHRDVKPQNILLDSQKRAHLTDFDLVWAPDTTGGTQAGALGTFLYAAPEEMEDASHVDVRADVYSLAMSALFVLHGRQLPRKVLDQRALFIDRLPCREEVRAVLRRSTASDPDDRPPTVAAFCAAFAAALSIPASVPPASGDNRPTRHNAPVPMSVAPPFAPPSAGSPRWLLVWGGLLAIAIAALSWVSVSQRTSPVNKVLDAMPPPPSLVELPADMVPPPFVELVPVQVQVLSRPSGADVYIDGNLAGKTPYLFQHKPGTMVRVEIRKRGFEPYYEEFQTDLQLIDVKLDPVSPSRNTSDAVDASKLPASLSKLPTGLNDPFHHSKSHSKIKQP